MSEKSFLIHLWKVFFYFKILIYVSDRSLMFYKFYMCVYPRQFVCPAHVCQKHSIVIFPAQRAFREQCRTRTVGA